MSLGCALQHMKSMCTLSFFLLLLGCGSMQPSHPDQIEFPALEFQVPAVERRTLANDIQLYLKQDNELPLVQISAMIGVGGLAAPRQQVGFEELFPAAWRTGGTQSIAPEVLDERLDQIAANLSASMGPYTTQLELSVRARDLEEGLAIFAELLRKPVFSNERLELARLQAKEQVRRQNDDPNNIARRLLMAAVYPGHYLGQSPTIESLSMVSRQDLVNFQEIYFAPNNLFLAISGDFDRQELLVLLREFFGDWVKQEIDEIEIPPVEKNDQGRIQLVDKQVPQTTLLIGDLGLTKDHPDHYAAKVFNYILGGGGFNSRLMREIRSNRGLAYSAYSYLQVGRRLPGAFVIGTETKNESVPEAISLIRQILLNMRGAPVSLGELSVAKDSQINSFVFGFDDTHAIVVQKMQLDFFGFPKDYLETYRDQIAAVTVDDVLRVAREFIRLDRQQFVLVGDTAVYADQFGEIDLPVENVKLKATELE